MNRKKKINKKKLIELILIVVLVIILIFSVIKSFKPVEKKPDNIDKTDIKDNKDEYVDDLTNLNEYLNSLDSYDEVSMLQYENGTILERLNNFSQKDKRINEIIKNYDKYPEKLLESLSRNIELTEYVMDYLNKKGNVYSDNIGNVTKGEFPLLLQWDERWGYGDYGKSNIAISGCGPTSLAMVIAGLTGKNDTTPYDIAKFAVEKGYYQDNAGTTWSLMSEGAKYFGLQVKELPLSKQIIYNALKNNHPVICNMRKGDFTINGHYIVLVGIKDDKIVVNDPNSRVKSRMLWEYERIESQIKNLWEFSL